MFSIFCYFDVFAIQLDFFAKNIAIAFFLLYQALLVAFVYEISFDSKFISTLLIPWLLY